MIIIYIIIGCALASIALKLIKSLDNSTSKNSQTQNSNNSSITIKDGMNLYFGRVLGKLFIIVILFLIIFFIIPLFL